MFSNSYTSHFLSTHCPSIFEIQLLARLKVKYSLKIVKGTFSQYNITIEKVMSVQNIEQRVMRF